MTAYYNEIDEQTAHWLRELIAAGHIAPGDVDTRSIEDVRPDDLRGYKQCHFFAGIGVWSYALRAAGWPDDRPVWTGSCPCQPFSAAGKGAAFADERHLWPAFHHLIAECRPAVVLGEQVASSAVDAWIDLVHADLEAMGYAFGSVPFPSAGVGAPHIRDRNYWVAHAAQRGRREERAHAGRRTGGNRAQGIAAGSVHGCGTGRLAHHNQHGRIANAWTELHDSEHHAEPCGGIRRLGNASGAGLDERERERGILGGTSGAVKGEAAIGAGIHLGGVADTAGAGRRPERADINATHRAGPVSAGEAESGRCGTTDGESAGPTNGRWRAADWLQCTDGKWRPVEPGTFPLAHGAAARVGRLRAYGNAINAEAARVWIETVMECMP